MANPPRVTRERHISLTLKGRMKRINKSAYHAPGKVNLFVSANCSTSRTVMYVTRMSLAKVASVTQCTIIVEYHVTQPEICLLFQLSHVFKSGRQQSFITKLQCGPNRSPQRTTALKCPSLTKPKSPCVPTLNLLQTRPAALLSPSALSPTSLPLSHQPSPLPQLTSAMCFQSTPDVHVA